MFCIFFSVLPFHKNTFSYLQNHSWAVCFFGVVKSQLSENGWKPLIGLSSIIISVFKKVSKASLSSLNVIWTKEVYVHFFTYVRKYIRLSVLEHNLLKHFLHVSVMERWETQQHRTPSQVDHSGSMSWGNWGSKPASA